MELRDDAPRGLPRRRFLGGAAAAAAVGTATTIGVASPAGATNGGRNFAKLPMPKPIAFSTPPSDPGPPDPFNSIHWTLPGPEGSATQKIGIPAFGPDTDPNTIGDFDGFTAYAVVAGEATSSDGETFDCEFDVRVMQGRYVAEDGNEYHGTFAFI
ncbi:MAG: hypothetical protein AAGA93_01725 [Actinomycetota bacterium]